MNVDQYVGRIDGDYSIKNLQANLAHEDLARRAGDWGVDTLHGTIYPVSEEMTVEDFIASMTKALSGRVTRDYQVARLQIFVIISDAVVISVGTDHGASQPGNLAASISLESEWTSKKLIQLITDSGYTIGHEKIDEEKAPISFAMPRSDGGVRVSSKKFDRLPLSEVARNYRPEVIEKATKLVDMLATTPNGIVIVNGPPGTGKSYLIRAILWELRGIRLPIVCTPPQQFLTDMGMLTTALMSVDEDDCCSVDIGESGSGQTKSGLVGSVVIMEDVGDLLVADNVTHHIDATSNLLNFADGLLSLLANTIFILTFNHEVAKINPALTRPGRCVGRLSVDLLDRRQAMDLTGLTLPDREYSLAEVYEMKRTGEVLPGKLASVLGSR